MDAVGTALTAQVAQWLTVRPSNGPLVLSMPHTGTELPLPHAGRLVSAWLARKDTDWWIDQLYEFGAALGATIVRTSISRTVIDVNRDPSGRSLYPGQATTQLCPTTTFDGEPLYEEGLAPDEADVAARRSAFFQPYHEAIASELARLRAIHSRVVLYDCHSIRSQIPRLFAGALPHFNIGTYDGKSCFAQLTQVIERVCDSTNLSRVTNGRFKGGYTTRHYGRPDEGIHAVQMELACRGYLREPEGSPVREENWPPPFDAAYAEPLRETLQRILEACITFARRDP
jgi:N-formylglutamate deformylase